MAIEQLAEDELHLSEVQAKHEVKSAPGEQRDSLWRNRNFNIFWFGQTLSALGDAFSFVAMPLLVLEATGSVAQMGIVTALMGVGQIVAGIFSGLIVDRFNRRLLMSGCDVIRTLIYGAIPLCWWLFGPQVGLIYIVMLLGGFFGNLAGVAYVTAVTNLVDKDEIVSAVSRLETTFGMGYILGPFLAGIISHNFGGPVVAIGIDAVSFAFSFLSLLLIRFRPTAPPPATPQGESIGQNLLAGVRFLFSHPVLRSVTILLCLLTIITYGGIDLFIFHIKHDLGGDDNAVGLVTGLAAIGGVLASVLVPFLRRHLGFGLGYIGGTIVQCLGMIAIGLASSVWLIAPFAIAYVLGERTRGLNSMTLRQQLTPNHLLGRTTAAFWTIGAVLGPFGAALITALAAQIGTTITLLITGSIGIAIAIIAFFTPVNIAHPEKENGE